MLSSGLLEFLFYLLIPVVLVSFFQGRQSNDSSVARKKQFSRADYAVYALLLLLGASYVCVAVLNPPPNVFKTINAHPSSGCSDLRSQLRTYARTHPHVLPISGPIPVSTKNDAQFDLLNYYMGSEYGQLDFLVDRFCTFDEDRHVYLKFGERAFMQSISSSFGPRGMSPIVSSHGSDVMAGFADIGFVLFATSSLFFAYLPALATVGIVTMPFFVTDFAPSRARVRPWGVLALTIVFCADIYWLFVVPTISTARQRSLVSAWIISPDHTDPRVFFADSTMYTRRVFIAACVVSVAVIDYLTSSRQTDVQLLKSCVEEQSKALAVAKDHTVLETAVLLSHELRDRMVSMWKREQVARDKVFSDEFKQVYEDTARETKSVQWVEQNAPVALERFGLGVAR
ncbi:hypothetical protein IW148_003603 [Coemansia sp. RSA 1199]|nr:hypothetical protein IW148_003603 [Coemansia sp. RSA 1199]